MNTKKIKMFIVIVTIIGCLGLLGPFIIKNKESNNITEYTPEEEISDVQIRSTNVKIYFVNKNTNKLESESVSIDSKKLLENPYQCLLSLLLKGPSFENLVSFIPDNTKILSSSLDNNTVIIDFSKDFISNNLSKDEYLQIIQCIRLTLSELNEVNNIKINIEGDTSYEINDINLSFENTF